MSLAGINLIRFTGDCVVAYFFEPQYSIITIVVID